MSTFPSQSKTEWLAKVAKATKGAPFDADDVLFQRIDGPRALRQSHAPWTMFARVDHPDAVKARKQAEDDIAQGVEGLVLTETSSVAALETLPLHRIALRNELGDDGAEALQRLIARLPLDPARLMIDFGIQDAAVARAVHVEGYVTPLMKADGTMFHSEGTDDAQELGGVLAEALGRLRMLDFLDDAALAQSVSMKLTASQDMFSTLAKFRAARILWREILQACKLPDAPLRLHGETSRVMMANVDAHMNIVRTATAVFGAGLGGADSICVLPFSFTQGLPNSFARRVARNVQNLLLHESHLWRVSDPAAGAGAIENLTERICDQAWSVMQDCERGNWPRGSVSKVRPVIGVSAFRPEVEMLPEVEPV